MGRRIVIDPVTRIEGHAKISIFLNDDHSVADARFHVAEFRGFERFCEGRPLWEMPGLTARICGICPVSHLMASAKAGDAILAVKIPPAAETLRRLMNLGQIVQSHALSFFHLSGPDLLLGFDADPAGRNVFGLARANREAALRGIRLRQFGQEIIERLGGRKIHPSWCVPGGVRAALTVEGRDRIKARLPEAEEAARYALGLMKGLLDRFADEASCFGNFPTLYCGLVAPDGSWEHYDGRLRLSDAQGNILVDSPGADVYREFIAEVIQPDSYLKSPYYRPLGIPGGMYRVGPIARLNLCDRMGTPLADAELTEYRQRGGRIVSSSFWYHYARLIEILASIERIGRLIDDPDLRSDRLRAEAGINATEGVGVSEAPRGTLFHHYQVDRDGLIRSVNLIIATGQNNLAMNATVLQIARRYITGPTIPEGVLNRLEAGIRAFDPCLSCSTHALGQMPMVVRLVGPDGDVLHEERRD
ncbi:Ni/Fe hydrogenase subunit alpha [Tautonia sociabilis]|uniref:Ni/Fe hydrogenase subunit alpha n=1 Tax=Tautonia sociabilis TaxID=2080755 RepID=A0A432MG99_9BACT|nr:Ni/Fe hydrogenase subunit alpha [Tautonia sociabilis]RUL85628.1 Ni/Fe hydrogenase subunit alpha [Tautonia sociabilis]